MSLQDRASYVQNLPLSSVKVPAVVTIVGESEAEQIQLDSVIRIYKFGV